MYERERIPMYTRVALLKGKTHYHAAEMFENEILTRGREAGVSNLTLYPPPRWSVPDRFQGK